MNALHECIIISEIPIAAHFSGSDVWVIPVIDIEEDDFKNDYVPIKSKAYVSDHWSIVDGIIRGQKGEECWIAVEINQFRWIAAPKYMQKIEG